jgi:dolichol kinase
MLMDPPGEIVNALILAGVFLMIIGLGEVIYHFWPARPELSRKSVHFLSGVTALSFPYFIQSSWLVLLLALGFSSLIFLSKKRGILRSLNDVSRKSHGALFFPVAVYVIFLLSHNQPVLYFVSILIMTVSDTLAALIGEIYGHISYEVEESTKSLEGSVIFFLTTFLCVHLSLLFMTPLDKLNTVLIAVVIAILVTGFEAISFGGSDNLFIPFGTYCLLRTMISQPAVQIFRDLWMLVVMIAVTVPLVNKTRLLKPSALIGMVLVNYAAWALCDLSWLLPLLLAQIMVVFIVRALVHRETKQTTAHQIKGFLYNLFIPTVLIFVSNIFRNWELLYITYVAAIVAQVAVIFSFFLSIQGETGGSLICRTGQHRLARGLLCGLTSTLVVGVAPIALFWPHGKFVALVATLVGVFLSIWVFEFLAACYDLKERTMLRQQMRLLSVAVGTLAAFGVTPLAERIFL